MTQRRLAIVTGASSGIGAATAAVLAADGWRVVLVARGLDALEQVQQRIHDRGGDAVVEVLDASDGDAVVAMAERVLAEHGTPEVIVNAAGAGQWQFIEDTPPSDAILMMGAPFFAAYNVTHAFMAAMLERGAGVLVHVGSPASITPWPGATAYVSARWALRGLHEALRQDLIGTGVSSCHIVFGEVASPYFQTNAVPREQLPTLSRWVRPISPEECAAVILHVIRLPRDEVIHPRVVQWLAWAARLVPPVGRWVIAHGAPRH
jgi:NADP-dependent 3-hydroxy acid dehydrogenase YdfG